MLAVSGMSARLIKVLAIGNSFSVDALEQEMHNVVNAGGDEIVIGNLYHPGCSIERHYNNMKTDYGNNQMRMYRSIVDCAIKVLADNPELKGIIPVGTAIQNARMTALGDDLTRDGYHLSYTLGRYIASLTWYGVLYGHDVLGNSYSPARVNAPQRNICQEAAEAAIINPFRITL